MYGQYLQLVHDNVYAGSAPQDRNNLKTGNGVSSDLLREVDLKTDGGKRPAGRFPREHLYLRRRHRYRLLGCHERDMGRSAQPGQLRRRNPLLRLGAPARSRLRCSAHFLRSRTSTCMPVNG